jgi:hypothetical protein
MEIEDIPPSTLKPAPVIVACEIVTEAVPVLVRVRDWVLLEPVFTFPKARFVALAASDPDEAVLEVLFAAGVPAPVNPVHPVIDKMANIARKIVSSVDGLIGFETKPQRELVFGCDFMAITV